VAGTGFFYCLRDIFLNLIKVDHRPDRLFKPGCRVIWRRVMICAKSDGLGGREKSAIVFFESYRGKTAALLLSWRWSIWPSPASSAFPGRGPPRATVGQKIERKTILSVPDRKTLVASSFLQAAFDSLVRATYFNCRLCGAFGDGG